MTPRLIILATLLLAIVGPAEAIEPASNFWSLILWVVPEDKFMPIFNFRTQEACDEITDVLRSATRHQSSISAGCFNVVAPIDGEADRFLGVVYSNVCCSGMYDENRSQWFTAAEACEEFKKRSAIPGNNVLSACVADPRPAFWIEDWVDAGARAEIQRLKMILVWKDMAARVPVVVRGEQR